MRISDWSSDVCSSDLGIIVGPVNHADVFDPDAFEFPGVSNDQVAGGFAFIALCQAPFECLAQSRFRKRLWHEVDDTVLECLEGAVGIRGDDDGIERAGNRALQQVEAIAAMKVQIKEKEIRHRRLQMSFGGPEIAKDLQPLQDRKSTRLNSSH